MLENKTLLNSKDTSPSVGLIAMNSVSEMYDTCHVEMLCLIGLG